LGKINAVEMSIIKNVGAINQPALAGLLGWPGVFSAGRDGTTSKF